MENKIIELSMVKERILLVDDQRSFLVALKRCMSLFGLDADVANNGKEAQTLLEKETYGVLITDLIMPELDGIELTIATRENFPGTDILVMSGCSDESDFSDIIAAGAIDFIAKPFSNGELKAKLQRIFRERLLIASLEKSKSLLATKADELEESNTALRILIKNIEQEKKDIEEDFHTAITARITPFINKLEKLCDNEEQRRYIASIKSNINDLTSPTARLSFAKKVHLTVNELQVADMVQKGLTSKDIADIMNISYRTVEKYRGKIRKKCGISNSKVNLRNILSS
jgi:DNA-binding NarL/FixJ family response regulator